jgi:HlyD family secretion protein
MSPESLKSDPLFRVSTLQRLLTRLRRNGTFLVWIVVLIGTVSLYRRHVVGVSVIGFVEEIKYNIAAETAGRLQGLDVRLNDNVLAGQIVAYFEDDELLLKLREARSELDRVALELGREKAMWELDVAGQQIDQQTNLRRFARDAENSHINYLQEQSELTESKIKQQGLELELNRNRLLRNDEHVSQATLDDSRIAYEILSEKIANLEPIVESLLETYMLAEERYQEFVNDHLVEVPESSLLLKPFENAIKVQQARIEQVNLAISRQVLRAPIDGLIAEIYRRAGEVVPAGQPVLSIIDPLVKTAVAYLPESRIDALHAGAPVRIRRAADASRLFESQISSLGVAVEQLPGRLNPGSAVLSWGRAVYIHLPDSLAVLPGEALEFFF